MPYADYEKHKARSKENYYSNKEHILENVRKYYRKNREKRNKQKKAWAEKHKDELRVYRREYYRNYYRYKLNAHQKVYRAVMSGQLVRPESCSSCGRNSNLHGHHKDYKKPLHVIWLCVSCHKEVHHG